MVNQILMGIPAGGYGFADTGWSVTPADITVAPAGITEFDETTMLFGDNKIYAVGKVSSGNIVSASLSLVQGAPDRFRFQ